MGISADLPWRPPPPLCLQADAAKRALQLSEAALRADVEECRESGLLDCLDRRVRHMEALEALGMAKQQRDKARMESSRAEEAEVTARRKREDAEREEAEAKRKREEAERARAEADAEYEKWRKHLVH